MIFSARNQHGLSVVIGGEGSLPYST
jgi:hypothetical protein